MRCLGIPNTAHFANVTQIEDAVSCKSLGLVMDIWILKKFQKLVELNASCLFVTAVWAKLKSQKASERWQPDTEVSPHGWYQDNGLVNNVFLVRIYSKLAKLCFQEEYEDSSGNVVNKKTYEDLKRQGLLQIEENVSESHRRHGKTSDEHPLRLAIFFITHFSFYLYVVMFYRLCPTLHSCL